MLDPCLVVGLDPVLVVDGALHRTPFPRDIVSLREGIHVVQGRTLELVMTTGTTYMACVGEEIICSLDERLSILSRQVVEAQIGGCAVANLLRCFL